MTAPRAARSVMASPPCCYTHNLLTPAVNVWNWNNTCATHVNTCGPHVGYVWIRCDFFVGEYLQVCFRAEAKLMHLHVSILLILQKRPCLPMGHFPFNQVGQRFCDWILEFLWTAHTFNLSNLKAQKPEILNFFTMNKFTYIFCHFINALLRARS